MWTRKEMNLIFLTISVKESTETSYSDKTIFISSLLWSNVRVRKMVTFGIFVKTKGNVFLYFICETVFKISELMFSFVHFIFFFYNRLAIILAHKIYTKLKVFITKIPVLYSFGKSLYSNSRNILNWSIKQILWATFMLWYRKYHMEYRLEYGSLLVPIYNTWLLKILT